MLGRHVSTFIRSSSDPLGKQIQELSIFQCIVGSHMLTDCVIWMLNTCLYTYIHTYKLMYFTYIEHNCKHLESHNILKYRQLLDLFSQRVWRWPNKGRNMSPWQNIICIVCKIKCFVIDWHVVFICYNISGWKTVNLPRDPLVHTAKHCLLLRIASLQYSLHEISETTCLRVSHNSF